MDLALSPQSGTLLPGYGAPTDAGPALGIDIAQVIEAQGASTFVLRLVLLSCLVTFFDGFDLNVLAFVAPYLKAALGFDQSALGTLFASANFGTLCGGLLFGLLGDRFGRRRAIIGAVGGFALLSMLLTLANSYWVFLLLRFGSGIALGGAIPLIWALNIEYVPRRFRATVVTLIMLGYGLGVSAAGPVAIALIPRFGWHAVFGFGGAASLIAAVLVWGKLPESLRYLALRGTGREQMMRIVRRLSSDPRLESARLVLTTPAAAPPARGPGALFQGPLRLITPLLWLAYGASTVTIYFFVTWAPILFEQAGLSRAGAAWSSSFNALVGAAGGLALMRFTDRRGPGVLAIMPALAVPVLLRLGLHSGGAAEFMAMTTVLYLLLGGSHYGVQSILGLYYPTAERARGTGWAASIGKLGAIAAPLLGAWLLRPPHTAQTAFLFLAVCPALFALAVYLIGRVARRAPQASGA